MLKLPQGNNLFLNAFPMQVGFAWSPYLAPLPRYLRGRGRVEGVRAFELRWLGQINGFPVGKFVRPSVAEASE